jgi:hypothetical protein
MLGQLVVWHGVTWPSTAAVHCLALLLNYERKAAQITA